MNITQAIQHFVANYGVYAYAIFFLMIFCETGLVIFPFLPGDTLLFACGSLAASGSLSLVILIPLLIVAALCGDNLNYCVGRTIGHRLTRCNDSRFFKKRYLDKTHAFYAKYGGKTIIIARFVAIVRTFAPFVAGLAEMPYRRYVLFCLSGATLWVVSISLLGYAFGNISVVKHNFVYVIFLIIILSCIPAIVEWLKYLLQKNR